MPPVQPWRTLPLRRRVRAVALVVVIAVVGVLLVVLALDERASTRPVSHGVRTEGFVVAVHTYRGRSTTYRADVAFTPPGRGATVFRAPDVGGHPRVGDRVPVSYAPSNPSGAHELAPDHDYLVELVLGVVLLAFALFLATARLRRAARLRR